jgi:hypothetical protein
MVLLLERLEATAYTWLTLVKAPGKAEVSPPARKKKVGIRKRDQRNGQFTQPRKHGTGGTVAIDGKDNAELGLAQNESGDAELLCAASESYCVSVK